MLLGKVQSNFTYCQKSEKVNSFSNRLNVGKQFEMRVMRIFEKLCVPCHPFGLGELSQDVKNRLISMNDTTSLLLRFMPDFILIFGEFSCFCECKSVTAGNENSGNFSYSHDSYMMGLALAKQGIRILTVFGSHTVGDLRACWLDKLPVSRVCEGSSKGSGKPYVLVPKVEILILTHFLRSEHLIGTQRSRYDSFPDLL